MEPIGGRDDDRVDLTGADEFLPLLIDGRRLQLICQTDGPSQSASAIAVKTAPLVPPAMFRA